MLRSLGSRASTRTTASSSRKKIASKQLRVTVALLASLYPDDHGAAACAGAALISYNNKPAKGAIPAFEEVVL